MPWFPWEQIYGTVGYDPASDRAWGGEAPGRAGILRATDESYSEKRIQLLRATTYSLHVARLPHVRATLY